MAKPGKSDSILTPDLIKIIKIFGVASLALVIFFSFFDSRRANNSGEDPTFRMTNSARMYFMNLRAIHYERELRKDAGMQLFRHKEFSTDEDKPNLILVLILNPPKDQAYIYLEPISINWPISLRLISPTDTTAYLFKNGNKADHFRHFELLKLAIDGLQSIEIQDETGWIPLWDSPEEKKALKAIREDFHNLTH